MPAAVSASSHTTVQAIGTLITAFTAIGALVFTGLSLNATRDQVDVAQQGQYTDRYTKAVEQLDQTGPEHLQTRLGGIYALQRLTVDSPRDQPTIVNLLLTFITSTIRRTDLGTVCPDRVAPDIQAALTVLIERDRERDADNSPEVRTRLPGACLTDAQLAGVHLTQADLTGANLAGTDLAEADLSGADLREANLSEAELRGANLNGADLREATLDGADLMWAKLTEASFEERDGDRWSTISLTWADLTGAQLREADLTGADLHGTDLTRADLRGANLSAANLRGADLTGADLRGANLSAIHHDGTDIDEALTDSDTIGNGGDLQALCLRAKHDRPGGCGRSRFGRPAPLMWGRRREDRGEAVGVRPSPARAGTTKVGSAEVEALRRSG
jgi:uncharacterized protein YjbI with pentapeptide repeats